MRQGPFAIVGVTETVFFSRPDGQLSQWIMATVESRSPAPVRATVRIRAGGREAVTRLDIAPGTREYRCYAPALWPDRPPDDAATLTLTAGRSTLTAACSVGRHRPWTVYLLSDVCTDYTWNYATEAALRADDADLTEAELVQAEATASGPEPNRNHYSLVHAREIEFYLERYPNRAERLFGHVRSGTITLNPFLNMCLTGDMSLEELVRHFYPARTWAVRHGLELRYANHQETPTIAWAAVSVLSGSGVRHLVKSILPYECPWVSRLEEPPIFLYEGPDGSRILVRRRNQDYVEGHFVLHDPGKLAATLHENVLPAYEALGERYPFDAVGLVGCYGDLAPHSEELPARKTAAIIGYNAQGWEYPRLVNASHEQFWRDIEAQVAARRVELPVFRGDYGASWEAWPSSLAAHFAGWRRAQERAATADKLAAVLCRLDPGWHAQYRGRLTEGWTNLLCLADHAWNGATDANRALNVSLRRDWQRAANTAFDAVITAGLHGLGRRIPNQGGTRVAVFNALGWPRSGIVRLPAPPEHVTITDVATGRTVPAQMVDGEAGRSLCFVARGVPAVGYRVYELRTASASDRAGPMVTCEGTRLEGPHYALAVSPATGAIISLRDKARGRELVDPGSPYHLNQCLYLSGSVEHVARSVRIERGPCGPVFGQLVARAVVEDLELSSIVTIYADLDHVDIRNELTRPASDREHEVDFAFPFHVAGHHWRYEAPGVIINPETDYRPGAGLAVAAVRHFVDAFNDEFGVTLSQADSGLVEFGHRTMQEDPREPDMSRSTVLCPAMQNCIDRKEAALDQGGETHFTFRYSLRGHAGGFDPAAAVRFGWEDNNELLPVPLGEAGTGDLPARSHSFLTVTPDNVVLVALKPAEEEGLIVRLWECAGRDTTATIAAAGLGAFCAAELTDVLERHGQPLAVSGALVRVPLRAYGIATIRLVTS